jgi:hypothetical protein
MITKPVSENFNFKALAFRLSFLILLALISLPPRPADEVETVDDGIEKAEFNESLQAETDALLSLFGDMPSVPIYLSDEPILKTGTSTESGVAFTQCKNHAIPAIFVKKAFLEKTNRKQLVNILKHELTHAWLCRQQLMAGHDERFRQKFTEVGGFGN